VVARPRKNFALRLDSDVMSAVERLAAAELRSTNAQIEMLLREALKARRLRVPEPADQGDAPPAG
jgi:hypothetical protein